MILTLLICLWASSVLGVSYYGLPNPGRVNKVPTPEQQRAIWRPTYQLPPRPIYRMRDARSHITQPLPGGGGIQTVEQVADSFLITPGNGESAMHVGFFTDPDPHTGFIHEIAPVVSSFPIRADAGWAYIRSGPLTESTSSTPYPTNSRAVVQWYDTHLPNRFWFDPNTGKGALSTWWAATSPIGLAQSSAFGWSTPSSFLDRVLDHYCAWRDVPPFDYDFHKYRAYGAASEQFNARNFGAHAYVPVKANKIYHFVDWAELGFPDVGRRGLGHVVTVWDISDAANPRTVREESGSWDLREKGNPRFTPQALGPCDGGTARGRRKRKRDEGNACLEKARRVDESRAFRGGLPDVLSGVDKSTFE
ncbi:MAG: hypothetical protein M1833_006262 [Piccolia ochrophora]|nr:MAG: hypothetical protein M1833_006262 [Piccolia ochrophora]